MAQKRAVMTIDILGTKYTVTKKRYDDDPYFKKRSFDGYCAEYLKAIVYCDMSTAPGWEDTTPEERERSEKGTLRHEIVHAFLNESGLSSSASGVDGPWAKHEEMVDWFAIQGPKIYEAWKAADAL